MNLNEMLSYISGNLLIDELQKYLINDINDRIFCKGIHSDIELLIIKISKSKNYMKAISWGLSNFLDDYIKSRSNDDINLIKIDYSVREGNFLVLTKRRS
jgi:hypothetical protein